MRNKYAGTCRKCGSSVPSDGGTLDRSGGAWSIICDACINAPESTNSAVKTIAPDIPAEAGYSPPPGLMDHQRETVMQVASGRRHILLADQPGLGKTITALVSADAAGARRILVVCPPVVKINWRREADKWLPGRNVAVLSGRKSDIPVDPPPNIIVINYAILTWWADRICRWRPDAVIFDESHMLSGYQSQRTVASQSIVDATAGDALVMALTGTPVTSRVMNLVPMLSMLGALNDLGGFWGFAKRYAGARKGRFGWEFKGALHLAELHDKLASTVMVRRRKEDCTDLPARTVVDVPVEIGKRDAKRLAGAQTGLVAALADEVQREFGRSRVPDDADVSVAVAAALRPGAPAADTLDDMEERLAQAKLAFVVEQVESLRSGGSSGEGEQVVVMAHHREIQEQLAAQLPGSVRIYGSQPAKERQRAVDAFQSGEAPIIVCSIQAAGVGITLTAANQMVMAELPWTAAVQEQAIDRIHRIGQDSAVTAWRVIAIGTVDEAQATAISRRSAVAAQVVDGVKPEGRRKRMSADSRVEVLAGLVSAELQRRMVGAA